ncbi:NupC/NupG family nucleoside CNT transporter [Candidatus Dependentiae bacterium]|nr:NupC/NupG family nucleoside CNT transporter [Candidatus Dependentiae bacterium]
MSQKIISFYLKEFFVFSAVYTYFLKDNHYISFIGIIIFLLVAFIFSNNKNKINPRRIFGALALQFILAFFVLRTEIGNHFFTMLSRGFERIYSFADAGIGFLFGNMIDPSGPWGFLFIVKVVPMIIFFSALMSLLFHFGIIQFLVRFLSFFIRPILGTSGAETLCAAANSMLGPTEAPLFVKKYIKGMTESEILVVMISGMSTLQAGLIAVYSSMGVSMIHLLTASVMSIPGAILVSKILIPETKIPETSAGSSFEMKKDTSNMLDAIAQGTGDGLKLAANVAAMLIAFISLMSMADYLLFNIIGYSLNEIFSKLFSNITLLLGISSREKSVAGILLGQKLVINEFVAYSSFVKATLSTRTQAILTYALCGFSNFSVIGILIGGISALAPNKRTILTKFGLRALLGGTLVNLINAAIAGLLIS